MKETDLLNQCRNGERKGQRLLYERYVLSMARVCKRYVKNDQDVHQVLVEGFMKVFKSIQSFEFKAEGSLHAWIHRIMVNEALMLLRKNRQLIFVDVEEIPFDPTGYVDESIEQEEILQIVQKLPAGYRTVFNLYVIEGYSHKEIAELLKITESSSRSQLTHARARLKVVLTQHGYTYE